MTVSTVRDICRLLCCASLLIGACGWLLPAARAEVFLAQDEALKIAFPEADRVVPVTIVVGDPEAAEIEKLSQAKLETRIPTIFRGLKADGVLGYAVIDTHIVRTHSETVMIVLSADGEIRKTVLLAFHEPADYVAGTAWLKQFDGRHEAAGIKIGDQIAGIVGSTLTSQAIASAVRRSLAFFEVLKLAQR